MAEIAFEILAGALEGLATRGTIVTPPTMVFPFSGTMQPMEEEFIPDESRGTYHAEYRGEVVRRFSEWEGEGGADARVAPFVFAMWAKSVTAPVTPSGGTTARLWEYIDLGTSDTLRTATMYFKDPTDGKIFRAPFSYINELTISADSGGTDGVMWSVSGSGQALGLVTVPAMPAQVIGSVLVPARKKVFLDVVGVTTIGVTPLNEVVSTETTMANNISPKFFDNDDLTYTKIGRGKRFMKSTFVMEYNETVYNLTQNRPYAQVASRIRYEGDIIEAALKEYIELDVYGRLKFEGWETNFDTNRGMKLSVTSRVNAALGTGWRLAVQNNRTAI